MIYEPPKLEVLPSCQQDILTISGYTYEVKGFGDVLDLSKLN